MCNKTAAHVPTKSVMTRTKTPTYSLLHIITKAGNGEPKRYNVKIGSDYKELKALAIVLTVTM